ncbi:hypothetical protein CH380_13305 [Leptospira adleri]|uniref:Uncharacterized protein n=1 Tax=Leptospira adleri TaxID=2023186 RepID=A0A2M9YMF6_9LEPT|nr:hypothetical protein CH380_13305 [Leptospira adleri]PJZ61747.1 hypothetical protein CH376_11585 [Leptospira adleri]
MSGKNERTGLTSGSHTVLILCADPMFCFSRDSTLCFRKWQRTLRAFRIPTAWISLHSKKSSDEKVV